MHWFWRGLVAFVVAWLVGTILGFAIMSIGTLADTAAGRHSFLSWAFMIRYGVEMVIALACYGWLTRRYYRARPGDGETRCRRCRYILRGIREPRCPECGEPI